MKRSMTATGAIMAATTCTTASAKKGTNCALYSGLVPSVTHTKSSSIESSSTAMLQALSTSKHARNAHESSISAARNAFSKCDSEVSGGALGRSAGTKVRVNSSSGLATLRDQFFRQPVTSGLPPGLVSSCVAPRPCHAPALPGITVGERGWCWPAVVIVGLAVVSTYASVCLRCAGPARGIPFYVDALTARRAPYTHNAPER